ncbi:Transcription initiation factor TFIID subunit 4 [Balamuthia mandrillaris]
MSSTAPGGGAPDPLGDSLFSVDEMDGDAQQINLLAESLQKETVQSRNVAPPRQPPTALTPQQTTQQARPPQQQQPLATATQQRVGLPPSYTATAHRATTMSSAATNLNPQHTTTAQLSHQRPATTTNFHSTGMPVTSSATSTAPSGVSSYSPVTTTNAASAAAAAAARSAVLAHRPHVTALPPSSSPAPSVATGVPPGGAPPLTAHPPQSVTQHYQDVLRHLLSELQAGKITKEQFTHKLSASLGPATAMELIKKFSKPRAPQQSRVVSTQAPPHTTTPSSATHPQHHPQQPPPPQTSYKLTQGTTIPQQQPPQQPSHQQGRPPTQAFANVVDEQNKQQPIVRMVKRGTIHPPPSTATSTVNTPTPNISNPPIITDIKQPPTKKPRTTPTTGSTASTPSQSTQPPPPPPANNLSSSGGAPTQSAAKAKKAGAESKKADADQPTSLKQLNDVTQFAGVNLKEESLRFMRGEGKDSGMDLAWPEEDPRGPFLQREVLRRKVVEIGTFPLFHVLLLASFMMTQSIASLHLYDEKLHVSLTTIDPYFSFLRFISECVFSPFFSSLSITASIHQMKQIHKEVYDHLTCAVEERLRNIIEQLAIISQQRQDTLKDDFKITITSDPRRQLQLIEKREREEQEQRDAEEKERQLKGLKDDSSKKGDRETQARRHEEEERIRTRHANITALQAIGDIGRPRTRPTASTTTSATTSHLSSSQPQQQNQPPPSSPSSQQSQQPQITFTKEHLRKLQQLQQAKQAGTLTPEMAQEFERLALMFRRMTEQVQRQKASAKAAAAGGSGVVLSHLPASAAAGTTVGGARGRALGPQQQQTGRTINLKDLEFLFLKDPYLKHSKVIHKSFDRKRRKVTVGPSSLSASASSSTS